MKFYSIQQDKKYTDWVAMLPMSEEKRLNLSYHIKRDTLWSDPHDISMKNALTPGVEVYRQIREHTRLDAGYRHRYGRAAARL